jgi:hypothetical protein
MIKDIETQGFALTIEEDVVYAFLVVEAVRLPTGEIEMKQSWLIAKVLGLRIFWTRRAQICGAH